MAKRNVVSEPAEDASLLFESNASPVDCSFGGGNCLCKCSVCLANEEDDGRGGTKDGHCHNFDTYCWVPKVSRFSLPKNFFIARRRP